MPHQPLAVWLFFALLAAVFRRDRRWLARWPVWGMAMLLAAAAAVAAHRALASAVATDGGHSTFLEAAIVLASGFAVPTIFACGRAFGRQDWPRVRRWIGGNWRILAIYGAIGLTAAGAYLSFGTALERRGAFDMPNLLYDADAVLYRDVISGAVRPDLNVTHKHPVFPLLARGVHAPLSWVLPGDMATVAGTSLAGGLSVMLACFYARRVTGSALLGGLGGVLLACSAGHVVFCAVPETYAFSAAALVALHVLVVASPRVIRFRHQVLAATLAAGVTVTHLLPAAVCYVAGGRHGGGLRFSGRFWRAGRRWISSVLVVGAVLFAAQAALLPDAIVRLRLGSFWREAQYVAGGAAAPERVWNVLRGVFVESFVGCRPTVVSYHGNPRLHAGAYDTLPARVAAAVWLVLLGTSLVAAAGTPRHRRRPLRAAIGCIAVAGLIHCVYGNQNVFLYSCTFSFFVLALVVHGLARLPVRLAVPALVVTIAALAWSNTLLTRQILETIDRVLLPVLAR